MIAPKNMPQTLTVYPLESRLTLPRYAAAASSSSTVATHATWSRGPHSSPTTASQAMESYRPYQGKFVRPDTDEAASDLLAAFNSRSGSPIPSSDRTQFRTALEQASYVTNSSRMQSEQPKAGFSFLSRAARIFGM